MLMMRCFLLSARIASAFVLVLVLVYLMGLMQTTILLILNTIRMSQWYALSISMLYFTNEANWVPRMLNFYVVDISQMRQIEFHVCCISMLFISHK